MKTRSKKREAMERHYARITKERDAQNNREGGVCFFCGEPLVGSFDRHHLRGRDGDLLIEKEYIVNVHRKCHQKWHDKAVTEIALEYWFPNFMERLRAIDPNQHDKIIDKITRK